MTQTHAKPFKGACFESLLKRKQDRRLIKQGGKNVLIQIRNKNNTNTKSQCIIPDDPQRASIGKIRS